MYVGHVGVALGAKRFAPSVAFGALIVATYLPDWVDAGLCVTGRYHDAQMISHSVPAIIVLAVLAGATQLGRSDARAFFVAAAVVICHVLLDYLTGIKPTWPGGPFIGLQLYRRPIFDFVIESLVIVAGWMLYDGTLPRTAKRLNLSSVMLAVLLLMQAAVDAARLLTPSMNKC